MKASEYMAVRLNRKREELNHWAEDTVWHKCIECEGAIQELEFLFVHFLNQEKTKEAIGE